MEFRDNGPIKCLVESSSRENRHWEVKSLIWFKSLIDFLSWRFPTGNEKTYDRKKQANQIILDKVIRKLICGTELDNWHFRFQSVNWLHLLDIRVQKGQCLGTSPEMSHSVGTQWEWEKVGQKNVDVETMLSVSILWIADVLFSCEGPFSSPEVGVHENLCSFGVFFFVFWGEKNEKQNKSFPNSRADLECLISFDCIPGASCSFMSYWSRSRPSWGEFFQTY
jgi:hypothetical protein